MQKKAKYQSAIDSIVSAAEVTLCTGGPNARQKVIKLANLLDGIDKSKKRLVINFANNSNFYCMEQLAKWTHGQMMANLTSTTANDIRSKLDQSKADFIQAQALVGKDNSKRRQMLFDSAMNYKAAIEAWIAAVRTGASWDFKNKKYPKGYFESPTHLYDAQSKALYRRDLWGNLHFGFMGRSVGFQRWVLTAGAGAFQARLYFINDQWEELDNARQRVLEEDFDILNLDNLISALDAPGDRNQIEFGAGLFDRYASSPTNCSALTFKTLMANLRLNKNKLGSK